MSPPSSLNFSVHTFAHAHVSFLSTEREPIENENDARDGSESSDGSESGSRSDPFLLGQVDGVARGVVHGWACESGSAPPSSVSVFVDGFLVLTERAARPRGDKAIGRICGRRPAADPSAGFSAPLPALSPGVHEVRVFVGDAGGRFKSELGDKVENYENVKIPGAKNPYRVAAD